jgi:nitroreductase
VTKPSNTEPDLAERAGYLIELAARAPSVHNTQPWRFTVTGQAIELYADASRQLMEDLTGREMIISCGAALFGLRLAIRSLGCQPEVDLFPDPSQRHLLARVRASRQAPITTGERAMLRAVPHRHTHRGVFEARPRRARVSAADGDPRLVEPVAGPLPDVARRGTYAGRDAAVDPRGRQPG